MLEEDKILQECTQAMANSLLQLKEIIDKDQSLQPNLLKILKTFLLGVISSTVDLVEMNLPGSAALLYADLEAAAKLGGLTAITQWSTENSSVQYSVSDIAEDDMTTGMNYLGQKLSIALIKGLNELPMPLRNQEMLLRSIEVLLANLLDQKFENDAHRILDSFSEHVHMALNELESRRTN